MKYLNSNALYLLDIIEFASLRSECEQQIGQLIAPLRKAHSIASDVKY